LGIRQTIIDGAQAPTDWQTENYHDGDGFPEPLATFDPAWLTGGNPDPTAPTVKMSQSAQNGLELTFGATAGWRYTVEHADRLDAGIWRPLLEEIVGDGVQTAAIDRDFGPLIRA